MPHLTHLKMSENADSATNRSLNRIAIAEMLSKNFTKLPEFDQKLFTYGPLYLGANAGVVGLMANSLYRGALNVTQAWFVSTLPMVTLPFISAVALFNAVVSTPLMLGDLRCHMCAEIRGLMVGATAGAVYPVLLALPLNVSLAARFSTALFPEKGNMLRYMADLSKPVLRKMSVAVVLQAVLGGYIGSRQFQSYVKLAEVTFGSTEELKD